MRLAADNLQRKAIKSMLADWEREHPGRGESIFRRAAATCSPRRWPIRASSIWPAASADRRSMNDAEELALARSLESAAVAGSVTPTRNAEGSLRICACHGAATAGSYWVRPGAAAGRRTSRRQYDEETRARLAAVLAPASIASSI